jgi:cell division protein FtsB
MENSFYRKDGVNIVSKLLNKPEIINKKSILFLIIAIILLFLLFNNKGIIQRVHLEMNRKEINRQIQSEEQRQKKYQEEIYLLKNSDDKIEKIARERYNMKKPGETVYKKKNNK